MSDRTAGQDVTTGTVRIHGHQGDEIEAYLARPPSYRPEAAAVPGRAAVPDRP
jgi:hypothetical protein